jgi:hypothetical protein
MWGGMDWIDLLQNRDKWRAVVNAVMDSAPRIWLVSKARILKPLLNVGGP